MTFRKWDLGAHMHVCVYTRIFFQASPSNLNPVYSQDRELLLRL